MTLHYQPSVRREAGRRQPLRPASFPASLSLSLFSACRDPLLLIDASQQLRAINPAAEELLGCKSRQVCGRPWRHFFVLERDMARAWQRNPVVQCLQSHRSQPLADDSLLVIGNQRLPVRGCVLPVMRGSHTQALLYLQPLLEGAEAPSLNPRNEQEQLLLQHMSRLNTVSELATGIAHEMNQPLAAIMSFNQAAMRLLAEDDADIDRASEALAEAVNQTRRAAGILERLRAFVGRRGLELRPVAVNQVVINALTLLSNRISESGVRVSLRTEPCPPVRADALQLEQVMVNLLRNAVEAMESMPADSRRLQIATHTVGGRVHVAVSDSGPGLPTASTPLFTRFYTTKPDGMGLGLSICRSILEAAGGELSASNQDRNDNSGHGGACFRFSLPVCPPEEIRHGHPAA